MDILELPVPTDAVFSAFPDWTPLQALVDTERR